MYVCNVCMQWNLYVWCIHVCNEIHMSDVCMPAMKSACLMYVCLQWNLHVQYMYVMYVCNKICRFDVCIWCTYAMKCSCLMYVCHVCLQWNLYVWSMYVLHVCNGMCMSWYRARQRRVTACHVCMYLCVCMFCPYVTMYVRICTYKVTHRHDMCVRMHVMYVCIYVCTHGALSRTWIHYTAKHCNKLQHTATHEYKWAVQHAYTIPQHTATHCSTLQHTATHCNARQHTATHCKTRLPVDNRTWIHHTATRCNTWLYTLIHTNIVTSIYNTYAYIHTHILT